MLPLSYAENKYMPEFTRRHDTIMLSDTARAGDFVTIVTAEDKDKGLTCFHDNVNCACSQMRFEIELGNQDHQFALDAETGILTLARDVADKIGRVYKLQVSVVNVDVVGTQVVDVIGPKNYATLTVGVGTQSSDVVNHVRKHDNSEQPHHRQRRVSMTAGNSACSTGNFRFDGDI